jgi:hypothetical protein
MPALPGTPLLAALPNTSPWKVVRTASGRIFSETLLAFGVLVVAASPHVDAMGPRCDSQCAAGLFPPLARRGTSGRNRKAVKSLPSQPWVCHGDVDRENGAAPAMYMTFPEEGPLPTRHPEIRNDRERARIR